MEKIIWNQGWTFNGEEIVIPHTVKEVPFHYFDESEYQMVGKYRKVFKAPKEWKGKSITLTFHGAAHRAEVFLNGTKIGEHECGYTAFSMELAEHLQYEKENELEVVLDSRESLNIPPFGFVIDYMTYGGLYRDVTLEIREPLHIEDIFVKSNLTNYNEEHTQADGKLLVEVTLTEERKNKEAVELYMDGELLCTTAEEISKKLELEVEIPGVSLWDVEHPNLHQVEVRLVQKGIIKDRVSTRFGFRKAEFKADGFYLNEKKIRIRGLNRHQSYPYVGYAMPDSMQKYDADILKKELGLNAVRTSHYPQSHAFIDRCDELGLLVFTEIPGWQHIGDEAWKNVAVKNVEEMVLQYRNHTSIILWGVRINESQDDEEFYTRTNAVAHTLDDSRQTGGVRAHQKSQLLEDVYTYNDFVHDGKAPGCQEKKKVTSDMSKGYLVTEYNGHMYPTKTFDWEEHRMEHTLRHIRVLDAVAGQEDLAGSFGWCMFDYNTHKDFGSGDRICYHGVLDMFRNPKMASLAYACQQKINPILEITSSMDIGEHPGCNRGATYILTNADSVKMYKNGVFIKEYYGKDSSFQNLAHGPILIDDFIGNRIHEGENFTTHQADIIKESLNYTALHGYGKYPMHIIWNALQCMVRYHMKPTEAVTLFNKYIGDWGASATEYRFEAIKDGKVVKTVVKEPVTKIALRTITSHTTLKKGASYDVALVRMQVVDQNGNILPFYNEPLQLETTGAIELIGPSVVGLKGGMFGTYVKTTNQTGAGTLKIRGEQIEEVEISFEVIE